MVSPGFLREQNIDVADKRVEPLQAQGKTVVFVLVDGKLKGAIALADIVRPEAKQAIAALKALKIRCMMLTGDNKATAKWVSEQVGLDEYFAEVLPKDNAAKVKEVQSRGVMVAIFQLSRATYRKMIQNLVWARATTSSPFRWRPEHSTPGAWCSLRQWARR